MISGANKWKFCLGIKTFLKWLTYNDVTPLGEEATYVQKVKFKEKKKKIYKALFLIHSYVDNDNFEKVGDCDSTKQTWDILKKAYEGEDKERVVRLQTLKQQLELVQMEENKSINDY